MPKTYYCWRCKMPIPMLTDEEWDEISPLLKLDLQRIKTYRVDTSTSLKESLTVLKHQALDRYFEITGFQETNLDALWHHHISLYGDECQSCGHLFRTPRASFCANCGRKKD